MIVPKIVFIVFDGLGDRPIKELNNLTPLEAAIKPNLDAFSKMGINGLLHTVKRGIRPGSDTAHLSILGADPEVYYRGRGPFEAAGVGIDLELGDVALRGNVATLDKNGLITDRRAGRIADASEFAKLIDGLTIEGVKIIARAGVGHRMAIVLRGVNLSDEVTDADPHMTNEKILLSKPKNDSAEAKLTASIINIISQKAQELFPTLGNPSANCLLLRGAGKLTEFPNFEKTYGLASCCIAGGALYKGIAKILGFTILNVEGATGKGDTNIDNKIKAVTENLDKYDFFFVHLKGTDSFSEDGKPLLKKEYIERADKAFSPLLPLLKEGRIIISVTGDHTTSSELMAHTTDEVPLLVAGPGVRVDKVETFGERPAQSGGLGHMEGRHLIKYLVDLLGKSPLYGN